MRREQERRNSDMYSARVHGLPWRGGRQDARARRVGGGQGDGGVYRAPAGGRYAGRAPGCPQYGYGPRDQGFGGGYDAPRFPHGGQMTDSGQNLRKLFFREEIKARWVKSQRSQGV